MVGSLEFFFQPADVGRDTLSDGFRSAIEPVTLGHDHGAELAASSDQIFELAASWVRQSTDRGANHLGKVGQDIGIDAIGLGQLARGSGKVSDLTGVDDGQSKLCTDQCSGHRSFQIASGLQHNQSRLEATEPLDQGIDSSLVVRECLLHACGAYGDIESGFGHVNTDKDRTIFQSAILLDDSFSQRSSTLQMMRVFITQATVRALSRKGRDDPRLGTVSNDPGANGLSRPV
jgi:hypothetical protein